MTFNIYNETGDVVSTSGPYAVDSAADLPVNFTIPAGLADGNYTVNLTLVDLAGNEDSAILGVFYVDTQPPVISDIVVGPALPL